VSLYWIFKVKEHTDVKHIFEQKKGEKEWGLEEFKDGGKRRTANIKHLNKGDKVVFYLCGDEGYCIVGNAVVGTSYGILKSVVNKKVNLRKGIKFQMVNPWAKKLPIERLRGKVHFVPVGENFGSYIQGSVTSLSKDDYETIMQEHNKQQ